MAQFLDNWRDRWFDVLDWFDDRSGRSWAGAAAVVLVLVAGVVLWQVSSDSDGSGSVGSAEIAEPVSASDARAEGDSSDDVLERVSEVDTTTTSVVPSTSESTADTTVAPQDDAGAAASTSTSVAAESAGPAVSAPSTSDAGGSGAPGEVPLDYPTSPDGAPLPLLVVFDTETITISGQVPSQAAKDRLAALAVANSQFPDAEVIDNMVVNPAVPISVGARVIELNSARFPEASAEILPDHARELDRVVGIMNALPNISVLVVGHADQRGDDLSNFAISDERARAVVNYLIYLGIAPTRLASRAAGDSDLLTFGDDDASLALNRRTEFVFGGLLIE